jgi:predicted kinase
LPRVDRVRGPAGTGKTTLSQLLARQLKAAVLRIDAIETAIVRCGLATPPVGPVGYVVAQEVAAGCLAAGTSVVVDGVNPVPAAREGWRCLAAAAGVSLRVVEVQLDDFEEHRRRIEQRRSDLEGLIVPTWERVLAAEYQPWVEVRDGARLLVDGASSSRAIEAILRYVALPDRR